MGAFIVKVEEGVLEALVYLSGVEVEVEDGAVGASFDIFVAAHHAVEVELIHIRQPHPITITISPLCHLIHTPLPQRLFEKSHVHVFPLFQVIVEADLIFMPDWRHQAILTIADAVLPL